MKFGLREIIFTALLTAIPAGAWWFVFHPSNIRNAEMVEQIDLKRMKLKELNRATGTIGSLKKEIAALARAIEFLRSRLPDAKEIDKVLQEIWRLAEANQLNTKSIRTLQRVQGQGFDAGGARHSEQPIGIELEGNFMGFYAFLQSLENQPRIMRIRKMTLEKPKTFAEGTVRANFDMSIFFE